MWWVCATIAIYSCVLIVGVILRARTSDKDDLVYAGYKDLIPVLIAIPAAWLGYCIQRRVSYLQALRALWGDLIKATNQAVEYTRWTTSRSEPEFRATIGELSRAIDAIRGVFQNVPMAGTRRGLFPYENLKDIRRIVGWLGFEDQWTREKADLAHKCIVRLWGQMHGALLQEFDTEVPIQPVSRFLGGGIELADKLLQGKLNADDLQTFDREKQLPQGDE
jgi:hypothetical protein